MKRIILLVLWLFLGLSSWAQTKAVQENCAIMIKHEVTAPSCLNGMDGKIELNISGAKRPYSIQWSDEGTEALRSGLVAGFYIATVRDASGCMARHEVEVLQGKAVQGDLQITRLGEGSGKTRIAVLFANDIKPFAINIKNVSEGPHAPWRTYQGEDLSAGLYMIEAFTKAGCSQMGKIDLRNQQSKK